MRVGYRVRCVIGMLLYCQKVVKITVGKERKDMESRNRREETIDETRLKLLMFEKSLI